MIVLGSKLDCKSYAEKQVYDALSMVKGYDDYTAIFNLSRLGDSWESDVVLLGPVGVLIIEIKGGRVYRSGGIWRSNDKEIKDPTVQARGNRFKIRNILGRREETIQVYFGENVLLPNTDFLDDSLRKFNHLCGAEFLANPHKIIGKIISEHDKKRISYQKPEITQEKIDAFLDILLPELGYAKTLSNLLKNNEEKYHALNEQQYKVFKSYSRNRRISVEGPAGSGKTVLALNIAEQNEHDEIKTLLLCHSPALAAFLEAIFSKRCPNASFVSVMDVESLFDKFYESDSSADSMDEFYAYQYKELIIDEAQDLFSEGYLSILNSVIEGGLQEGRWIAFTDTSQRGLYGDDSNDIDLYQALQGIDHFVFDLTQNMRNTNQIIDYTKDLSSIDPGEYNSVTGVKPQTIPFSDPIDQYAKLKIKTQELLKRQGYSGEDISVVSVKEHSDLIEKLASDSVLNCEFKDINEIDWKKPSSNLISVGTSYSYKGLENRVIIVTDVENIQSNDLFNTLNYIGATRAKDHLIVFIKNTELSKLSKAKYTHLI